MQRNYQANAAVPYCMRCEDPQLPLGNNTKLINNRVSRFLHENIRFPIILAYHQLAGGSPSYRYELAEKTFYEHLSFFTSLTSAEQDICSPPVITFDDGHASNYSLALPILERYHYKAIFFVIVGRMGRHNSFMNWRQLADLISLGHRVEAHSWSHPFLTHCTDLELRNELLYAKGILEDRLGTAITALSIPHGAFDKRVLRACEEFGYQNIYVSNPWYSGRRSGLSIAGRLMVHSRMDSEALRRWFFMSSFQIKCQRWKFLSKQALTATLGKRLYHELWIKLSGWTGASSDVGARHEDSIDHEYPPAN